MQLRTQLILLWLGGLSLFAGYELYKRGPLREFIPALHGESASQGSPTAANPPQHPGGEPASGVADRPDPQAAASAGRSDNGDSPKHLQGYRDPGALQDEADNERIPPSLPESAGHDPNTARIPSDAAKTEDRALSSGTSPSLPTGERYYRGIAPLVLEAVQNGPEPAAQYSAFIPERPQDDTLAEAKSRSLGHLEQADRAAETGDAKGKYIHAILHLNAAALRFPGDTDISAAQAAALNNLARSMPPEERAPLFTRAAAAAAEAPRNTLALTQWGVALTGLGRLASGEEKRELFTRADEKLQAAQKLAPRRSGVPYALAGLAAAKGDTHNVLPLLERAAAGDAPVPRRFLMEDESFASLHSLPWFVSVAGRFPGSAGENASSSAQSTEAWLKKEKDRAKPYNADSGQSDILAQWAENLAGRGNSEKDPNRRQALLYEVDRLFTQAAARHDSQNARGQTSSGSAAFYRSWGEVLRSCTSDDHSLRDKSALQLWRQKAVVTFRKALSLEPDSVDLLEDVIKAYASLLDTCRAEEREALYEERNSVFFELAPAEANDDLRMHMLWTETLEDWANASPAPLRRDALYTTALQKLSAALDRTDKRKPLPEQWATALQTRFDLEIDFALRCQSAATRAAMAAAAESDAALILSSMKQGERLLTKGLTCLALNDVLDDDPAKMRHYAGMALDAYTALRENGNGEDEVIRSGLSRIFEDLGKAESDPLKKRGLFHLAALNRLCTIESTPCSSWRWIGWGIALSREAQVTEGPQKQALYRLTLDIFMRMEELAPGSEAYNIACILALTDNADAARIWLEKSARYKTLPTRAHMEKDTDMDPIRNLPWFNAVLPKE